MPPTIQRFLAPGTLALGAGALVALASAPWDLLLVTITAGGLAVVGIARHRTVDAVTAVAAVVWFTLPFSGLRPLGPVTVGDAGLIGLLVILTIRSRSHPIPFHHIVAHPAFLGLGLLLVGGAIGVFLSPSSSATPWTLIQVGPAAMIALVAAMRLAPRPSLTNRLMIAWVLGSALSVILGIALLRRDVSGRAIGLANHPNQLAMMCAMSLPFLAAFASRAVRFGLLILLFLGVVQSGSRSGLLAFLIVALLVYLRGRLHKGLAIVSVGMLVMIVITSAVATIESGQPQAEQTATGRALGSDSALQSNESRLNAIAQGLERSSESPLTGRGFLEFERPHSLALNVWSSAGVIGVLGLTFMIACGCSPAIRGLFTGRVNDQVWRLSASFVGYVVVAMVNNALWNRFIWAHLGLLAGVSLTNQAHEDERPRLRPTRDAGRLHGVA